MGAPKNYHPHSRYTLHEKPELYPGLDFLWGRPDGPVFDLKVDIDNPWNNKLPGTAYIRVEDVVELAHCLGMITREEAQIKDEEIAHLKALVKAIPTKVEDYINGLNKLSSDFLDGLAVAAPLAAADLEDVPSRTEDVHQDKPLSIAKAGEGKPPVDRRASKDHPSSRKSNGGDKPDSNEPAVGKGSDDVPSARSNVTTDPAILELFGA